MPEAITAYIALGANMDEPERQIRNALSELARLPETRLVAHSDLYRSRAEGYDDQPDFLNAVAKVATRLEPQPLLDALLQIEHRQGRKRTFRNAPRTLDLDILLYDDRAVNQPGLHIPHPRMHQRGFVLIPLAEIEPDLVIPERGPIRELIERLTPPMPIRVGETPD